jgi:hypothetical protein
MKNDALRQLSDKHRRITSPAKLHTTKFCDEPANLRTGPALSALARDLRMILCTCDVARLPDGPERRPRCM